jgi:hypothetical protein
MTVLPTDAVGPAALFGQEGELVSVRISVEPRLLEDLLEALAVLDFPVNPQLYHHTAEVEVEFPAYSSQIEHVREVLQSRGFGQSNLELSKVLARAQASQ